MSDSELLTPNSLPIPRDRLRNFWYVPPAHGSDTVFVFLHGINSDSRSCWLHADPLPERRVFWPDLVRNDSRLGHPSIYMAGYLTNPEAGRYGIADCAQEVLHALEAPDAGGWPPVIASPRIAFICHSTGGIVARYMIERWDEKFRDHPIGLALIASPSLGSRWANLLSPAFWVYNQRLGLQLRSNDPVLADPAEGTAAHASGRLPRRGRRSVTLRTAQSASARPAPPPGWSSCTRSSSPPSRGISGKERKRPLRMRCHSG